MTARDITMSASGSGVGITYVDDVFSTYLYTGNGSTQTINNGIDLAGKGGMVWVKRRSLTADHILSNTARPLYNRINTNSASAESNSGSGFIDGFTSSGFTVGNGNDVNGNTTTYISWTFRKASKFFDVVTYTGNGSNRTIAHNLGSVPGMIIVKRTDTTGDWQVYHRSLANTEYLVLNATSAKATGATRWNSATATASSFSLGTDASVNALNGTYVAYVFAHDTASDGLINCGFYTFGSVNVNLGWEPQFVLAKRIDSTGDWAIVDNMRSLSAGSTPLETYPNLSNIETSNNSFLRINATGFSITPGNETFNSSSSGTWIYLAIRRPNKPPTSGTKVFAPATRTGTGATATTTAAGFPVDLVITKKRSSTTLAGARFVDRLRGATKWLDSTATTVETATADTVTGLDAMTGMKLGADATTSAFNTNTHTYVDEYFKRAQGLFDVVCDTGTGAAHTISHNLCVVPELMIRKGRSGATQWEIYSASLANTEKLVLNTTAGKATDTTAWNSTSPTASVFTVGTGANVNTNNATYVTYLFATLPGISKVGSYTGNGSSQTINCGFASGARFVLIKRTNSTGDWYVWDSARGIVGANDPHLSLNTTAAEVTTDDSIDPDSTGFIVNQVTATDINVSSATYIYLAIA